MGDNLPTWPQTFVISACGAAFIVCGYLLSRMRESWGPAAWTMAGLLALSGTGFILTVFLFYLRPRYGGKAFPVLLLLLLGHLILVAVLWKAGILG